MQPIGKDSLPPLEFGALGDAQSSSSSSPVSPNSLRGRRSDFRSASLDMKVVYVNNFESILNEMTTKTVKDVIAKQKTMSKGRRRLVSQLQFALCFVELLCNSFVSFHATC